MFTRIGKYNIEREVGRGGFGQVYRAFDPSVGRAVAIKVLNPGADASLLKRFRNEASTAGNLQHRHIVTVYEFGEQDGLAYLVMEFLEGQDLQRVIQAGGPGSILRAVQIMTQVASGLHSAHLHGVVHRDVKPANIMLLPDGNVKIMDFGIARLSGARNPNQTQAGIMLGSLRYMSPEQFGAGPIDALCDIWGAGIIYYELIAGRHPFAAQDPAAIMYQIRRVEPQPLRELVPACPAALAEIIGRALAKDRELRYQSLEDLRIDSEPILLELQKEEAARLVRKAQGFAARGEWELVESFAKQILDLDSTNQVARELRETIRRRAQRRSIQARTEALVKQGTDRLSMRQYQAAVEAFEAALRLDDSDPSIRTRLKEARDKSDQVEKAEGLVKNAKVDLASRNFSGAFDHATEALRIDPGNPDALATLSAVTAETQGGEPDRQQRLRAHVETIKDLLKRGSAPDAAARLQSALTDFPEDRELQQLLSFTQQQLETQRRAAQEKEAAVIDVLRKAEALARQKRGSEALEILTQAAAQYPDDARLPAIRDRLREHLRQQEKTAGIRKAMSEAEDLLKAGDLDRAIALLQSNMTRFPDSDELRRAYDAASNENASRNEQRAALDRARRLEHDDQRAAAWGVVRAALRAYPNSESLQAYVTRLRSRLTKDDRAYIATRERADIEELILGRRYAEALDRVEQARTADEEDESLQQLNTRVQSLVQEVTDRYASRIQAALAAGGVEEAEELLADGLRLLPAQTALVKFKSDIERQREFRQLMITARQQLEASELDNAEHTAERALTIKKDDPGAQELLAAIARQRADQTRKHRIDHARRSVRELLARGQFDDARKFVNAAMKSFPEVAEFQGDLTEIDAAQQNFETEQGRARSKSSTL